MPPPEIDNPLGVNIHFTDPKAGEMEMIAAGGFRWVRMDYAWGSIERERGQYNFSAYDRLIAALEKQHMHAIFILDYSNRLYDNDLSPYTEEGRQAFARWAAASAQHFKGHGILWEIYNEPNGGFWRPKANVDDYAKLALAVGKALRAAAPTETYIGPATSTVDFNFLEACFKAGLLQYWSAVSIHPYRQTGPESAAPEFRRLRQMIAKYAPTGKQIPIISGEWGYSAAWGGYTEEKQGKMLPRQWLNNLSNDIVLSIWYDWHDDGTDPKEPEHHFGTVANAYHPDQTPVYTPKPAYLAAKTLTSLLNGYHFNKRLMVGGEEDYVLLFSKGNEVRLAAWTTAANNHPVTIPASPGSFQVTGYTGDKIAPLAANTKGLAVTLTDTPQYLVPTQPNEMLRLAADWERLPPEIVTTAPNDVRIPANLSKSLLARNPTEFSSYLGPHGNILKIPPVVSVMRSADPMPVRIVLTFPNSRIRLVQETQIIVTNPLRVTLLPRVGSVLPVRVENPTGGAFRGTLNLTDTRDIAPAKMPIQFQSGQTEQTINLPAASNVAAEANGFYGVGLNIQDDRGKVVLSLPVEEFHAADNFASYAVDTAPGGYAIVPEGDPKVASEQTLTTATPPAGLPAPGMGALKITYRFDAGWKFVQVQPKTNALKAIKGQPKALGLWVYGDGSGNIARMRFTDATGQTFQPEGEAVKWKGWRYITFPLDGTHAGFWGNDKADGTVHYPIHIDTLFLFDSANRQKQEGTVYISSPTLIY